MYRKCLSKPIFVVGYMHSGTTLLRNILQRNTAVFSGGGETKYFDYLPIFRRTYPNLGDDLVLQNFIIFVVGIVKNGYKFRSGGRDRFKSTDISNEDLDALLTRARRNREHGAVFRAVFDHLAQMAGKTQWLEKTPTHVFHVDRIVRSIPNARFVEIVRDPRDILASKKTRRLTVWKTDRYKPEQKLIKHQEKAYDPFWDSLAWKSAIRAGWSAREKYPDRVLSIRYEDLVSDVEAKVLEICDFLKLEFQSEMLNVSPGIPAEWGRRRNSGVHADSIGRWQRVLKPAEVALCQWLVKGEMHRLGYSRAPSAFVDQAKIPFLILKSIFEFFQRLFRRWRLGGFSYFVNVLINYCKRFRTLVHR